MEVLVRHTWHNVGRRSWRNGMWALSPFRGQDMLDDVQSLSAWHMRSAKKCLTSWFSRNVACFLLGSLSTKSIQKLFLVDFSCEVDLYWSVQMSWPNPKTCLCFASSPGMLLETIHPHVLFHQNLQGEHNRKCGSKWCRYHESCGYFCDLPKHHNCHCIHWHWLLGILAHLNKNTDICKVTKHMALLQWIRMKVDELHVMSHLSSKVTKDYHIELKQRGVTSLALVPYESDEKRCQQADVPAPWRFQGREGSGWFPLTKMYSINGKL